ncbi:dephospho-CoA kinase [Rheinheimera sp. 4Y26]|uniref:dephospho-CoA kinase n=1 Tax=Rheinheimera sp. 4Y26 TaxID=2977811 RepID=UPI0021B0B136|nr:dephospho-CoA kinase [Rheinheimera sp. 4Y26]MCT6698432.1 dephospho-CoA kinase [Rheinheimera sp. 4Y26]
MSKFIVGLTGGIGSGKTTVANEFAKLGIQLVDADLVAREVVAPGSPALTQIAAHFGEGILLSDGSLNRALLRERIFSNEAEKHWLNQLLHPLIRQQLLQQLAQASSLYVILVAPLLIENKLQPLVDQLLVVDVSPDHQLSRTAARDQVDTAQVAAIMASQCTREQRLAAATQLLDNNLPPETLPERVMALHQIYSAMAAEKLAKSRT